MSYKQIRVTYIQLMDICRWWHPVASPAMGHWDTCLDSQQFIFSSLWSKSDSQLSKYCVVYEITWCRCQQLTALSISTAQSQNY